MTVPYRPRPGAFPTHIDSPRRAALLAPALLALVLVGLALPASSRSTPATAAATQTTRSTGPTLIPPAQIPPAQTPPARPPSSEPASTEIAPTAPAPAAGATPSTPPATADLPGAIAELDQDIAETVARHHLPGLAVAIVHQGRPLLVKGYGVTRVGGDEPVSEHTVFRIASLSKGFAATLAAQLVREGALHWDMAAVDQLPVLGMPREAPLGHLTVRDILSHRIGIQSYNYLDRALEADQPYPLLAARLGEAPMRCPPGECYAYQNIAFSLIGDLSFAVTGEFFPISVHKRILLPLAMRDTSYGLDALRSSPSWARPHVRRGRNWQPVEPKENYYRVPPAAGVNASANDLGIWLLAQLGHRPGTLPPALLAEIHTPLIETPDQIGRSGWRAARLRSAHYALGWRVFDYSGERVIYHAGAVQGYRAALALLPSRDVGIALLWHSEHSAPNALIATTLDRALGLDQFDWREPPEPPPQTHTAAR